MIAYRSEYKYQLAEDYVIQTNIIPDDLITTEFIDLSANGILTIRDGYAWDGPSGPTVDTKTFMRGSLVHDAFYQLMREGHLDKSCRNKADRLLKDLCKQDGMCSIRTWWVYNGVKWFAEGAAKEKNKKKIETAP
jgi:hypothetical protein